MGSWARRGLLLEPPRSGSWSRTHAALPTPLQSAPGHYELFFSSRDDESRARVGRAYLTAADGHLDVTGTDEEPVLELGPLGAFDDCGLTVSCAVRDGSRTFLYYTGWTRAITVPFHYAVGLAIDEGDGAGFRKHSLAPILDRCPTDPFLTASPYVLREGGRWRMWYVASTGWSLVSGVPQHRYHIKYAESDDGIRWDRRGTVAVDYRDDSEYALSRPWVLHDGAGYQMWFSARGDAYRLGFAESVDGITWTRREPPADLPPSTAGWDTEMVAYPAFINHESRRYLLYNGAGYGRDGIGYAVWENGE